MNLRKSVPKKSTQPEQLEKHNHEQHEKHNLEQVREICKARDPNKVAERQSMKEQQSTSLEQVDQDLEVVCRHHESPQSRQA